MQFIDLAAQQKRIRSKIEANISAILDHGQYIMGPEIKLLEERLANYAAAKHAIGCASGTDALLMALMAFDVAPGDAIFTSPFTFIATAEVIRLLGATPVFVDIDPQTYNIDPAKLELAIQAVKQDDPTIHPIPQNCSQLRPKGIVAVDLFGLPANYGKIETIAEKERLMVIEDAAQAFGAEIEGTKAGAFGHIACTSFFPAKPLGGYGDGGMCFTNNDQLFETLESLRIHGKGQDQYHNVRIGVNSRLDTLQAGILLAKFDVFPEELILRQQVANVYHDYLGTQTAIVPPVVPPNFKSAWAQYSICAPDTDQRTKIQTQLKAAQIPTAIYYPKPLHLQTVFAGLGYHYGDFPVSEDCAGRIFSLPMHPYLTEKEQEKIAFIIMNECPKRDC